VLGSPSIAEKPKRVKHFAGSGFAFAALSG
jgi:hypothetical protein